MTAIIETSTGPLQGFIDTHALSDQSTFGLPTSSEVAVQKYLGIPYGSASRWSHAKPAIKSSEVLKCVEFGPACPQPPGSLTPLIRKISPGAYGRDHIGASEDDLFTLNVFASDKVKQGDDVPVMAWIHGGSWKDGASKSIFYDPTNVIRDAKRPMIFVSINYRVNMFGFFASKDLVDEDGLVGNYGVRDQLLALKWINQNISLFGGNKDNVTIFGESAGAASVGWHIGGVNPLFRRAILQSGAASTMGYQPLEKHEKAWEALLTAFDIDLEDPDRAARARKIPTNDLVKYMAANPSLQWSACVESGPNAIWSSHPDVRIAKGEYPESLESVMLGCCADEGTMFTEFFQMAKSQKRVDNFLVAFGEAADHIRQLYPGISDVSAHTNGLITHPVSKFLHDALFEGPVRFLAETLIATPQVKTGKSPAVYLYESNALLPAWSTFQWGAHHYSEVPFVFNSSSLWGNDRASSEGKTSARFGENWTEFAATGKPDARWPQFSENQKERFVFANDGETKVENVSAGGSEMGMMLFSQVIRHRWGIEEKKSEIVSKI